MYESPGGPRGPRPEWTERARKLRRNAGRFALAAIVVIAGLVTVFSSVYTLDSGSESVITRFGAYQRTITEPGLHFKAPFIDAAYIVPVSQVRRMEFGVRPTASAETVDTYQNAYTDTAYVDELSEALMLTQEENLVIADWVVQYTVTSSYDWLFRVDEPENTLRIISESAYRRVTAAHPLDDILTDQKESMQAEIAADLQAICNQYQLGVYINGVQLQDASAPEKVKDAFLDVTNAMEDKNTKINDAEKYANERLPVARGEAAALRNSAEGYRQQRVNEAEGAVARYQSIEAEYAAQPEIMKTRLYMEMIREVLPKVRQVYFVDDQGSTLQFLPLDGSAASVPEVQP